jgi:hypothetical protein
MRLPNHVCMWPFSGSGEISGVKSAHGEEFLLAVLSPFSAECRLRTSCELGRTTSERESYAWEVGQRPCQVCIQHRRPIWSEFPKLNDFLFFFLKSWGMLGGSCGGTAPRYFVSVSTENWENLFHDRMNDSFDNCSFCFVMNVLLIQLILLPPSLMRFFFTARRWLYHRPLRFFIVVRNTAIQRFWLHVTYYIWPQAAW